MVDFEVREADLAGFQSLMIPPVREGFRKPRPKVPSGSRSTSGLAESNYIVGSDQLKHLYSLVGHLA